MIKDQQNSCTSELGAEILMVITSFIIAYSALHLLLSELNNENRNRNISDQDASLFLSSAYALFLPLMSYMFSQAKQYNPEGRAQVILIWMVLIEIIRIHKDPIFTWRLQKSAEQLVRLFWVGFLVYSYTPVHGIMASLFVLCVYFAVSEVLKGVIFNIANDSYLIGKNPKVIHNYMKSVMLQDNLRTTPMSSCDYIVMGEENHKITVCDNGYHLGEKKSGTKGILTIGRVFQLNSTEDEAFTSKYPYWRDTCLSHALAKMLRRRFAKLPLDESGSRKALNFVLEGLIDYIGGNQDIQMNDINGERNSTERVFIIIEEELKLVSEFLNIKVPILYCFDQYLSVDIMGVYIMFGNGVYLINTVSKRSSAWLSLVAQQDAYNHCFFHIFRHGSVVVKILSILDLAITVLLFFACIYIQYTGSMAASGSKHWSNIRFVKRYIKDPARWYESYKSQKTSMSSKLLLQVANFTNNVLKGPKPRGEKVKKARAHCSVLDAKEETVILCIKFDWSILLCLPKWIRGKIPIVTPTISHGTDAKEAILRSLRNSGGQLTSGETSLKNHGREDLNWACQPNGSTTEAILVWHIATTLFHHQGSLSQQNSNPHQRSSIEQNMDFFKKRKAALELSNYCHYLVAYFPELLPDEVDWTKDMYESVRKEILAIDELPDQESTKIDRCIYALRANLCGSSVVEQGTSSMVQKGAKLAKDLMKCADGAQAMLADFWAEMMLFIAPSDNVDSHEKILYREELITQLWALLTHAGILTRPKPTEHHDHVRENNEVTGDTNV